MKLIAASAFALALALPAYAGGAGETTYTSYDAPVVRERTTPTQVYVVPAVQFNDCCGCDNLALAMSVGAGAQYFTVPGETRRTLIYRN